MAGRTKAKILGMLRGIIASAKEPSRNNRQYTEGFWDYLFNTPYFQEGIKNKVFFGQLFHPADPEEYSQVECDDRSAIVLVDVKKVGLEYIGTFEILPTKAGQCLRNLLDIGCIFGVSSRGLADFDSPVFDENIAETYDLITWDIVGFPGVKSCRLREIEPPVPTAIAEGYGFKLNGPRQKPTKAMIMESLNKISASDPEYKRYIAETLKVKEGFNDQLQVEDMMTKLGIPSDLAEYADTVVWVNSLGLPIYDDGTHGEKEVARVGKRPLPEVKPNDVFLVDSIAYNEKYDRYFTTGEWTFIGRR